MLWLVEMQELSFLCRLGFLFSTPSYFRGSSPLCYNRGGDDSAKLKLDEQIVKTPARSQFWEGIRPGDIETQKLCIAYEYHVLNLTLISCWTFYLHQAQLQLEGALLLGACVMQIVYVSGEGIIFCWEFCPSRFLTIIYLNCLSWHWVGLHMRLMGVKRNMWAEGNIRSMHTSCYHAYGQMQTQCSYSCNICWLLTYLLWVNDKCAYSHRNLVDFSVDDSQLEVFTLLIWKNVIGQLILCDLLGPMMLTYKSGISYTSWMARTFLFQLSK